MSIQQNVNQLLAMTGTAAMLSPQLRQKAEDNAKLRKLAKEESSLKEIQESDYELMKSPEYIQTTHRINKLRELEDPTDLDKAELSALLNERTDFLTARDERFNRLVEIANERAELDPTKENIEEARKSRTTQSWKKTIKERGKQKREEANKRMQEEGQNKIEQKTAFQKFRDSLDADDIFHKLSPEAQKVAYQQYTGGNDEQE